MKTLIAALVASFALATPAIAQDRHRDWDDRGRYEQSDRHRHHDRDDRDYRRGERHDRWDRDDRREHRRNWRRGERIERNYYRSQMVVISDWEYRRYGLRAPPRGCFYLRDRDGSIVLVAIGNSVVVSVIR